MRADRRVIWTDDAVDTLRGLWPCLDIPLSEVGRRFGVSASAISSKAHRIGLRPRPAPMPHGGRPKGAPNTKPRFVERAAHNGTIAKQPVFDAPPVAEQITLPSSRYATCRYPLWPFGAPPPRPALFCGAPTDIGSWCLAHAKIVFQPPQKELVYVNA